MKLPPKTSGTLPGGRHWHYDRNGDIVETEGDGSRKRYREIPCPTNSNRTEFVTEEIPPTSPRPTSPRLIGAVDA